jgi:hypothetical protein
MQPTIQTPRKTKRFSTAILLGLLTLLPLSAAAQPPQEPEAPQEPGRPHGHEAQDRQIHADEDFGRRGETPPSHEAEVVDLTNAPRIEWTNPEGGRWSDPANWSGGAVPGPEDHALITLAGDYTVTLDADARMGGLTLGGPGTGPTLRVPAASLVLRGPGTVSHGAALDLAGGILTGPGDLEVHGTLGWSAGTLSGAGEARIAADGRLNVTGGERKYLSLRNLRNAGVVDWSGSGNLVLTFRSVVTNLEGGRFLLAADLLFDVYGPPGPRFENRGLFRKVSPGTTTFEPAFENAGTVEVHGTLELTEGYTQTGGVTLLHDATMESVKGIRIDAGALRGNGEG